MALPSSGMHNTSSVEPVVRFGVFEFNLKTGELRFQVGGGPVDIGEKRSKVLRLLVG